jgi:hypothetical protein
VKPDANFNALCKHAVEGSENPNDLVVLIKNEKVDKYVSLLYEEILKYRCYDHKKKQYVVFEVKLTPEA